MKVVFLLDNSEYIEVEPTKLQLRQIDPAQTVLGLDVVVPMRNEDGTPKLKADGTAETQIGFRPIINYATNLIAPGKDLSEDIANLKTLLKAKKEELAQQQADAAAASAGSKKVVKKAKRVN